jgi:ribonuclease HI
VPWRKARFKDSEVLARCDADGRLAAQGGRVEIRYRASDARIYNASLGNLAAIEGGEIMADDACADAQPAPARGAQGGARGASMSKQQKSVASGVNEPLPENAIVAYTDGACSGNPGPSGVGVVLIDGKERRELSEYLGTGTNNIAELTAIELAVRASPPDRPIRVHTDSTYAIGVLTKGWKAKANQELIARLRDLLKGRKVQIVYVPGHAGVLLNERADVLAVQAVQQRASTPWQVYGSTASS